MPSIERPLRGDVLVFDVAEEQERAADPTLLERSGRNARTLVKDGPLRLTLVVVAPGGAVAEHRADGPILVQPIEGAIVFEALGRDHELRPGQVLAAAAGVPHRVRSDTGGAFLLTVVQPGAGARLDVD